MLLQRSGGSDPAFTCPRVDCVDSRRFLRTPFAIRRRAGLRDGLPLPRGFRRQYCISEIAQLFCAFRRKPTGNRKDASNFPSRANARVLRQRMHTFQKIKRPFRRGDLKGALFFDASVGQHGWVRDSMRGCCAVDVLIA